MSVVAETVSIDAPPAAVRDGVVHMACTLHIDDLADECQTLLLTGLISEPVPVQLVTLVLAVALTAEDDLTGAFNGVVEALWNVDTYERTAGHDLCCQDDCPSCYVGADLPGKSARCDDCDRTVQELVDGAARDVLHVLAGNVGSAHIDRLLRGAA